MKDKNTQSNYYAFKKLIKLLKLNYRILEDSYADKNLLLVYNKLLNHLDKSSYEDIEEFFSENTEIKKNQYVKTELTKNEILNLELDGINRIINEKETTRKSLETIASVRFGMTRGEISQTKNKEKLIEKLQNFIDNEKTHVVIMRQASKTNGYNSNT